MYLTIMNLPQEIRFKQENVMLVGLIPGPREPKHDINCFLSPLVHELLKLWKGVEIKVLDTTVLVHCALLCIACDIPAARKVCGFLGHSAELGCSRCYKKFSGTLGDRDYSGFIRSQWTARTAEDHRRHVSRISECNTPAKRESKYGCRYSVLLDLPYFDPVVMTIIDPMHNLYLGSAISIWMNQGLITSGDYQIHVPRYVGRIPHKISSSFSGFTFVQASRILCQLKISDEDIKLADAFLLQFCCQVEKLYGNDPNMHLHCHLQQVLRDYGPVYSFWLFS